MGSGTNLKNRTANELAAVKNEFLRALRGPGGADIVVQQEETTGGTFDSTTDTFTGGTTAMVSKTYARAALLAPVRMSDVEAGGAKERQAFSLGYNLGAVGINEVLVCKVRPTVPLNSQARYLIAGSVYRFDGVLQAYNYGPRLPIMNLVKFVKA